MTCHVCGGSFTSTASDMPFKLSETRIVIVRGLPVLQCGQCDTYLIEDPVMARLEELFARSDTAAELEILRYAA